jgi:hypothetical protein
MATVAQAPSDIPDAAPPTFKANVQDMTGLQRSGVNLAWGVLAMIGVLALALLVVIGIEEGREPSAESKSVQTMLELATKRYAAASEPDTLKNASDLMMRLAEVRRSTRDFWVSYSQMLLLNLLLPVLTSILGYVFGTSRPAAVSPADGV